MKTRGLNSKVEPFKVELKMHRKFMQKNIRIMNRAFVFMGLVLSQQSVLIAQDLLRNKMESSNKPLELTPEEEAAAALTAIDEQRMKGETEATVRLKLEALVAHENPWEVPSAQLMLLVQSFTRLNPSKIAFLEDMLVNSAPDSLVFSIVAPELVGAGNESAQISLVRAAERKMALGSPGLALSLVISIGSLKYPTDATIDWLTGLSAHSDNGIASTSLLALGSLAGEIDKVSQSKSLKVTQRLTNELVGLLEPTVENAKPETNERKALLLAALGNAGNASVEPIVSKVLATESDEAVRAEALGALRFVKTPTAKQTLFDNLKGNGARKIKEEIISAFRYIDLESRELDSLVLFLKEVRPA